MTQPHAAVADICHMKHSSVLRLSHAGRVVRTFPLADTPVEVGSHPACDITIHAADVPLRALLIQSVEGVTYAYDLQESPGLRTRAPMPLRTPIALGAGYEVTRLESERQTAARGGTERIAEWRVSRCELSIVCGDGPNARAVRIGDAPLSIGGAQDNAVILTDRAVSRHHCRIEPGTRGVRLRDLGSTNGSWVDGVRVSLHDLRPGAKLRLGRTDLRIVRRGVLAGQASRDVVEAASMLAVMADAERFAQLPWPVLILGETGVGKEHVARALHERGPRREGPFVALNGGGLPRELVESELFGHEKGAFTGALRAHRGAFERAHGGTLFLDEVAELPLELQTRLLRVLETWEVRRVGGESVRRVDVRLLCATHNDLRAEVRAGRFRADLFYRIHRFVLRVPALRSRPQDVEPLARHFLEQIGQLIGARGLSDEALARLRGHRWPGNVRELRNVLELAAVDCAGAEVDLRAIERALRRTAESAPPKPSTDVLREALEHHDGNFSAAARSLGIPRSTLRGRLNDRSS